MSNSAKKTYKHEVNMSQKNDLVNWDENDFSADERIEIEIQRCPHDAENPYTMIKNDLIRDSSISPACRWLIIYLLSNSSSWKINIKQIRNHLKGFAGKNKVYGLFKEALNAGYLKKEYLKEGNLIRKVLYIISETPKFKKCLRSPENGESGKKGSLQQTNSRFPCFRNPEIQNSENSDVKNNSKKEELPEEEKTLRENNTSLKVPGSEESAKADIATKVAETKFEDSPKSRKRKIASDFEPEVKDITDSMMAQLKANKPNFNPPANLSLIMTHVDYLLRLDKIDPQRILDVFSWAVADSFWGALMYKPNPAEYLRKKFHQLEMKMNSKPPEKERKFLPSSNQTEASRMAAEMYARGI